MSRLDHNTLLFIFGCSIFFAQFLRKLN